MTTVADPVTQSIFVPAPILRDAIRRCDTCRGESTRYSLGGYELSVYQGFLWICSTDGRRLAYEKLCETDHPEGAWNVDEDAADDLTLGSTASRVQIDLSPDEVSFRWRQRNGTKEVQCTPEGRFPRWRDILPTDDPVGVLEGDLSDLCGITPETGFEFSMTSEGLSVTQKPVKASLRAKFTGEPFYTLMNIRLIAPWLGVTKGIVRVHCYGPERPLLFTSGDNAGFLAMPLLG